MASNETKSQFVMQYPGDFSVIEVKKTVASPDNFVKWEVVLCVKPCDALSGEVALSLQASPFSTESPPKNKFVTGSCNIGLPGGCAYICYTYGCRQSNHAACRNLLDEAFFFSGFYFQVDGVKFTPPNTSTSNKSYDIEVTLRHFKDCVAERAQLPVGSSIVSKLKAMLDSGEMSDVSFIVGGEEIKAHSLILAASSDVFRAMFRHDTKDRRSGRITVKDVAAPVFKEMLRCLYTESEPAWTEDEDADDFLLGLLFLAEKYNLVSLRGQCQHRVVATTIVENVVFRLRAVHVVSPCLVPQLADPFVRMHLTEILSSESWGQLMKEDVSLAANVMFSAMKG